jgi:hypothetical protein
MQESEGLEDAVSVDGADETDHHRDGRIIKSTHDHLEDPSDTLRNRTIPDEECNISMPDNPEQFSYVAPQHTLHTVPF